MSVGAVNSLLKRHSVLDVAICDLKKNHFLSDEPEHKVPREAVAIAYDRRRRVAYNRGKVGEAERCPISGESLRVILEQ
jgi:hypothetical protein